MSGSETGPVQVVGEVLTVKRAGAYHHLTMVAPGGMATDAKRIPTVCTALPS